MKQEVLDKIELIKNSGNLSLEDYCKAVSQYLPLEHDLDFMSSKIECSENQNQARLGKLLLSLAKKGILPNLKGCIGEYSIGEASKFDHEDYIETCECDPSDYGSDEDGSFMALCTYDNVSKDAVDKLVSLDSVNVVSAFDESEVIATSTELEGYYFIIYHDGPPHLLATSDDSFIKALCSMALMTDIDVFFSVIRKIDLNNLDLGSSMQTVANIVFCSLPSVLDLDGFEDHPDRKTLYKEYWSLRG